MEMIGRTVIGRPVDDVWAYVQDLSNDANWRTGVDESGWQSEERQGLGAVGYTQVGNARVEWQVLSYTPSERIEWQYINGPLRGRGGYRLVAAEDGTEFTMVADAEPAGWLKLMGPLFTRMVRRQNQKDVETLRDILESMPDGEGPS